MIYIKKLLSLFLIACLLLGYGVVCTATGEEGFSIIVAGETISFNRKQPVIIDGIAYVPIKELFKKIGAVSFLQGNDAMVIFGKDIFEFGVGLTAAKKNNVTPVTLSTAPILRGNQILLASPLLTELFGASVNWNGTSRLMTVDFPPPTQTVNADEQNAEKAARLPAVSNNVIAANKMYTVNPNTVYTTKQEVTINDSSLPFTKALRLHTFGEPPYTYTTQLAMRTDNTVKLGDSILVSFYARAISSDAGKDEAYMGVVFEDAINYTKSLSGSISMEVGGGWRKYYMPFQPVADYGVAQASAIIRLGYAKQTIEIADFKMVNYQNSVAFSDLPILYQQYIGQDENAGWREDAWQRIEAIRKSDFTVNVLDKSGRPIPNVSVEVNMKRNEFDFGTAVGASNVLYEDTNNRKMLNKYLSRLFNSAVLDNELKWTSYEPDKQKAMNAVLKLKGYGLEVRGHTMIWDRFARYPTSFQTYYNNGQYALMHQLATEHVTEMGTTFTGILDNWDVVNEIMQNYVIREKMGDQVIVDWFAAAQAADPNATMFINENTIGFGAGQTRTIAYYNKLQELLQMGADIDGLGVQGHYGSPISLESFLTEMDSYAQLLPEIKMTEFDFDSADEGLQGDFTRDMMIACYSHPAFTGFLMWGFWDGAHWKNNAPLFTTDWQLKQSGAEYVNLVYNEFWTEETVHTDVEGRASLRGFHGEYDVVAVYDGVEYRVPATITAGGQNSVEIRLPFDVVLDPPIVSANDLQNTIEGLDLQTMEYAVSADGGNTFSAYTSNALLALGGSKVVKVRFKATAQTGASMDAILNFTPNLGDVNGDGAIDVTDIILTAEIATGYPSYTSEQINRANVNSKANQMVDISDVVWIAQRAGGRTDFFPAEL